MTVAGVAGVARRVVGLILVAAGLYLGGPAPYAVSFRVCAGDAILL
jgi:hypothetical protein